ncbi:MAG TPA: hypothetical protein VGF55_02260 [Gemmataceae bacterium]|jgi:hypothetical protein
MLNGQLPGEQFVIQVDTEFDKKSLWLQIHGNGIGNWNNEKQFTLTPEQIRQLAQAFRQANFTGMPASFGHGTSIGGGLMKVSFVHRVWLIIDGFMKYVDQADQGEQSKELAQLVDLIREMSAKAAKSGVSATDLSDGMRKLAARELAPEALDVYVNFRDKKRWMRIQGRDVSAYEGEPSRPVRRRLIMTRAEFEELFEMLRPADKEWAVRLPVTERVDLHVQVLNRRKEMEGRPAEGRKVPAERTERRDDFERVVSWLDKLHRRTMTEGYLVSK